MNYREIGREFGRGIGDAAISWKLALFYFFEALIVSLFYGGMIWINWWLYGGIAFAVLVFGSYLLAFSFSIFRIIYLFLFTLLWGAAGFGVAHGMYEASILVCLIVAVVTATIGYILHLMHGDY